MKSPKNNIKEFALAQILKLYYGIKTVKPIKALVRVEIYF